MRTDAYANALLDANDEAPSANTLALSHAAVFNGFPGRSGTPANEITGGAPAYARQPITWSAASARARATAASEAFDIPPGETVFYSGICSALTAGTVCDYSLLGNHVAQATQYNDTGDLFETIAHGYVLDDRVALFSGPDDAVPTGPTEGTVYWVINPNADDFQISATQGGAAVALTSSGECLVQQCTPEVYGAQGVYNLSGYTISEKL